MLIVCYNYANFEQRSYNDMRVATTITLSDSEKKLLEKNTSSRAVPIRLAERSKIVLLSAKGLENKVIAQRLNVPLNKVGKWRNRFAGRNHNKIILKLRKLQHIPVIPLPIKYPKFLSLSGKLL